MMRSFTLILIATVVAVSCSNGGFFVQAQSSGSGSGAGSGSGGFPNGSSFPWDIFPDFFKFAFNNGDFLNATFLFDLPLAPTQFDAVLTQVPEGLSGSVFYPAGYASSCGTGNAVATETKTCVDSLNTCSAAGGGCNAMKTCVTAYINCLEAASVSLVAQDTGKCSWPSAWVFSGKSSKELSIPVPDCTAFYANFQRLHFSTGCPAFDPATGTPGVDLFLECIAATSRLAAGVVQKLPLALKKTQLLQDRNTLFVRGLPPVVVQSVSADCNTTAAKCPRPNVDGSCTCKGRNQTMDGMYHSSYLYSAKSNKCSRAPVRMTVCIDEVQSGGDDVSANVSFDLRNVTNSTKKAAEQARARLAAANRMAGVLEATISEDCDAGRTPRRFNVLSKVDGASEPVGRELLVCAPPYVNVFIQSESTGACYQPIENQSCSCDGKTSNAWSLVYINSTNDASTSGTLITCALYTPPPTAQAITSATASFVGAAVTASVAKNLQIAAAATMIQCFLPKNRSRPVTLDGSRVPGSIENGASDAERAGGALVLAPFSLGPDTPYGKLMWLFLMMVVPLPVHALIVTLVTFAWRGWCGKSCSGDIEEEEEAAKSAADAAAGDDATKKKKKPKRFDEATRPFLSSFYDVATVLKFPSTCFLILSFVLQGIIVESVTLLWHFENDKGALGAGIIGVFVVTAIYGLHFYVGWRLDTDEAIKQEGWKPYHEGTYGIGGGATTNEPIDNTDDKKAADDSNDKNNNAVTVPDKEGEKEKEETPSSPKEHTCGDYAKAFWLSLTTPDGRWDRDSREFITWYGDMYDRFSAKSGSCHRITMLAPLIPTLAVGVAAGADAGGYGLEGERCTAAMAMCIISVLIYTAITIWYRPSIYFIEDAANIFMSVMSAILLVLVVGGSPNAEAAYLIQVYAGILIVILSIVLKIYALCCMKTLEEKAEDEAEAAKLAKEAEQQQKKADDEPAAASTATAAPAPKAEDSKSALVKVDADDKKKDEEEKKEDATTEQA